MSAGDLRVVAAAIRIRFAGALDHDQVRELVLSVPRPGRHHNVLYLSHRAGLNDEGDECEQGFVLSDGSFASRERARQVAEAAGQIIARCGGDRVALFSENLW